MQSIDSYSYQCGFIDCVNEMIHAGVKPLALSRPMDSAAERDALVPFAQESCRRWGNRLYIEDEPLLTDLFPVSMNQNRHNILLYRADHVLEQYLRQGESFLEGTPVWVCGVCGFLYVGQEPPALCPVCKVPAWKFEKVEGGAKR